MNPILNRLNQNQNLNLIQMIRQNPQQMFNQLMRTNPQFAQFVNENKGKSVEQIAHEYNVDLNALNKLIR